MEMTMIATRPLTKHFGVEVLDMDLTGVTRDWLYPEIRALFEEHSALLFRRQTITPEDHIRIATLFGPLEDRQADERKPGDAFEVSQVSNVLADGSVSGEMDLHTLNLKANQLWHTDSTFLPVPALANLLIGRVVTRSGGETELASTRAAWRDMPEPLKARVRDAVLWHRYAHSRARISPELAKLPMFHKWPDRPWPAIWRNPVNGREALYIASHAFKVGGMPDADGAALIDELIAFCTQPEYAYSHRWQAGDVLIWDERATLHRGMPWPYDEPRTLSSICVSVTDADGLGDMRARAA
jgi:alpha-ketoglutarate-dependent 2,4-dichlorophenoxyacetate dioxygenase